MVYVYNLAMQKKSSKEWDRYDIGMFSSQEIAEETAKRYLKEVNGFNSGNYSPIIKKMEVLCVDGKIPDGELYVIYGYNIDKNGEPCDMINSDCYTNDMDVGEEHIAMRRNYSCSYWNVDSYIVDECKMQDGIKI